MTPHYTHDPRVIALATQPHQLTALVALYKLSLEISKDKQKWDKFFKQAKEKLCIK